MPFNQYTGRRSSGRSPVWMDVCELKRLQSSGSLDWDVGTWCKGKFPQTYRRPTFQISPPGDSDAAQSLRTSGFTGPPASNGRGVPMEKAEKQPCLKRQCTGSTPDLQIQSDDEFSSKREDMAGLCLLFCIVIPDSHSEVATINYQVRLILENSGISIVAGGRYLLRTYYLGQ